MCGILCAVQRVEDISTEFDELWNSLKLANTLRGPDAQDTFHDMVLTSGGVALDVRIFASELKLRGAEHTIQPHRTHEHVLCFNGEIFEGIEIELTENDGAKLFSMINPSKDPDTQLTSLLHQVEGPYAMVYFNAASKKLIYGKDPLGRRSLLIHKPTIHRAYFLVTSVSIGQNALYELEELTTEQLHCLDLNLWPSRASKEASEDLSVIFRSICRCDHTQCPSKFALPPRLNKRMDVIPSLPLIESLDCFPEEIRVVTEQLIGHLSQSINWRICNIPSPTKAGGARVAVLFSGGVDSTILAYLADRYVPPDEPIDLLNVAFENPRKASPDQGTTKKLVNHEQVPAQESRWNLDPYLVPDREAGLEELAELQNICPHRHWNFIEINITYEETTRLRRHIEDLMFPCRTVMDLSLALALYFASRGVGTLRVNGNSVPYTSAARVLLNGLGADELLGGYGRHRTSFSMGGWKSLIDELQLDVDRIPMRNLGRDDRITSSHGKESRFPFLSLTVAHFISQLEMHYKLDPRLPPGIGDKMLLRLATRKLGLIIASTRKKRAMQFGTHSARMERGQLTRKGSNLLR